MKIVKQVEIMERHYNAIIILIDYIRKRAALNDPDAIKTLAKWDKERNMS